MKAMKGRMLAATASMLAVALGASASQARTISAVHARPTDPDEAASCYRWFPVDGSSSGLERTCHGAASVDLAVPIDTAGTKNLTVWAARPTSQHQLSCNAFAVTKTGGYVPGAVVKLTAAAGVTFQPLTLPAISVVAGGSLWVRCQMTQGTRIMEIELANP
jgi:hypothetical protein